MSLLGLVSLPVPAKAQSGIVVREIVVDGAQRIEPETVRSYLLIQEGDLFNPERVDRSLKSLFATGLFADVTISHPDLEHLFRDFYRSPEEGP